MSAAHAKLARLEAVCPLFVSWAQQELRAQRLAIERDQLARARNVGAGSGFVANHDFGPVIRFLRQEVEPEFRPDPNPEVGALVHGGRVRDGLRSMYLRGHITLQQWHAVCCFRDGIDIAAGARPEQPDRVTGVRSPLSGARWPDDVQIEALRRVRAVWAALPPDHRMLAFWTIIAGRTLDDYAKLICRRRGIVAGMFEFALTIIEEHFG